jgi:addiction module HigA family antidote
MARMYNPPHPGKLVKEYLGERSVTEVAEHIGVTRTALSRVINGQAGVSAEMSIRLGEAFNTSTDIFYKLQQQYDFWQAERAHRKQIRPLPQLRKAI